MSLNKKKNQTIKVNEFLNNEFFKSLIFLMMTVCDDDSNHEKFSFSPIEI